jgi:hypothetical protein
MALSGSRLDPLARESRERVFFWQWFLICPEGTPRVVPHQRGLPVMNMSLSLAPLIALIAGILILIMPRLLNYIVAIYLIVIGVIGLFGLGNFRM